MAFAATFGPHLPLLRRYARALAGSQTSGDAYVRTALEALAEDPSLADTALPARVSLYKCFHTIWSGTGPQLDAGVPSRSDGPVKAAELPPIDRQAFLLTSMEGFSDSDAALILNCEESEIVDYLEAAVLAFKEGGSARILIVEDEPIIAADLEALVEDMGHKAVGIAATQNEAVALANSEMPTLVLCDIQLADQSSGIDAASDILQSLTVPIIFITAFPERLLTGEGVEPTFLISKPYSEDMVQAAIGQALFFNQPARVVT